MSLFLEKFAPRTPWLKINSIDALGVIQRVSMLFYGHSDLIGGFNMFLPPCYYVETPTDSSQGIITVTTPTGVLTQMPDGSIRRLSKDSSCLQSDDA